MNEALQSSAKEKTLPPFFHVQLMDENLAFEYGKAMRAKWPEWRAKKIVVGDNEYTYTLNCPDGLRPFIEGETADEADFRRQLHEWYANSNEMEVAGQEVKRLQECETVFDAGIRQYLPLQKWGFAIPDQYDVLVTPFSIGGGGAGEYLDGKPVITMRYNRMYKGDMKADGIVEDGGRTREDTLLREACHLGADQIIHDNLSGVINDTTPEYQETKERIVDICAREVLKPVVLAHTFVQRKDTPHGIDPFLTQRELPVPVRLQNYAQTLKKL